MRAALAAALLVIGCASADVAGTYAGALADAKGREHEVRVTLKPDGAAALQASFPDRPGQFFAEGIWQQSEKRIVIELASESPERLVFARSGNLLVAREWNPALWGERGPGVLYRVR
jgi:hypothetical protein